MNETLQVPIGEQEHLKEFFKLLNENGQRQEAAEFSALVTQLSNMEQQYSAVLSELQAVRGQLDRIQDKGIKTALLKGISAVQGKVTQAKEQLTHIKADFSQSVKNALTNVKQQGISALHKAVDFMGLKTALADMRESLQSSISQTQKSIDRINAIGSELHALNEHSRNLGRALTGKETKELTARNEDKGALAAVAKPLKKSKSMLENMEKGVTHAIQSVERLEQTAAKGREQKPSIREGLKTAKEQERPKRTPSPQKKQEASL